MRAAGETAMARGTMGHPMVFFCTWLLALLQIVPLAHAQALDPGDALVLRNLTGIWPALKNLTCDGNRVTCAGGRVIGLALTNANLTGAIPPSIVKLTALMSLDLSFNPQLSGRIPRFMGFLSQLQSLDLSSNNHSRKIPSSLGKLSLLQSLRLSDNQLTGRVPPSLGRLSQLQELSLGSNKLNGTIPLDLGNLEMLGTLDLSINLIVGGIPPSFGNLLSLTEMNLNGNLLNGTIPSVLGNLEALTTLDLSNNSLTGSIPFSLGNLSNLDSLDLSNNQLVGAIPPSLGGLTSVTRFNLANNKLSGSIPSTLGNFASCFQLYLTDNNLSGSIPSSLGNISQLQTLILSGNNLTGNIPSSLGALVELTDLELDGNQLSGEIPSSLGNLGSLLTLFMRGNALSGNIPSSFGQLGELIDINLSGNKLTGGLSSLGGLDNLDTLRLNNNMLKGNIPSSFISETSVITQLDLSNNMLNGSIPSSLKNLASAQLINLANNQLTGPMPAFKFDKFSRPLNVSGNYLASIPQSTLASIGSAVLTRNCMHNSTAPVPGQRSLSDCIAWYKKEGLRYSFSLPSPPPPASPPGSPPSPSPKEAPTRPSGGSDGFKWWWLLLIILGIVGAAVIALVVFCFVAPRRKTKSDGDIVENMDPQLVKKYSLQELSAATDAWSEKNLLGKGGSGVVYRATLDGKAVAVKKLIFRKGATEASKKMFLNEVAILSKLRHKNLASLSGYCCQAGERILVMDLLENDSLSKHLFNYKEQNIPPLDWLTRCKVALGTAEGLHYLHALNEQHTMILHRDVKADNIMLDKDFNPYVCDFGIARLTKQVPSDNDNQTANRPGTRGYMAPEWVLHGILSDKLDVYSFGMVLVELVSGRPSSSYMETGEEEEPLLPVEAASLVFSTRPDLLRSLVDPVIYDPASTTELLLLLNIALLCLLSNPDLRPSMRIVVPMLKGELDVPPLPDHPKAWPWQGSLEDPGSLMSRTQSSSEDTGGGVLSSQEIIGR